MGLSGILVLLAAALLLRFWMQFGYRLEWMLAASVLALFRLQPEQGIRNLGFWFPIATLFLVFLSWLFITPLDARKNAHNLRTMLAISALCLLLAGSRAVGLHDIFSATIPPNFLAVLLALCLFGGISVLLGKLFSGKRAAIIVYAVLLITIFIWIKEPGLATWLSGWLRSVNHQNPALAGAHDLSWLGYSYIAFRLLHTLRDYQTGRLPVLNLRDYLLYVIFFPTLQAGPIDRIQRFQKDLGDRLGLNSQDFLYAGQRLGIGLMKKFVLANTLAVIALSEANLYQIRGTGWMWFCLYAYSFMIYFDFSGYTDIAIGLARLMGVQTPENFNHPYRQSNLTMFWNNWHITLTQWFRAYFFNPLTRTMRRRADALPAWAGILIPQILTMTLIGLWHGITWNFALWGIWHGLGLFVQNRWSAWIQPRVALSSPAIRVANTLLTFHFVSLGWVFFLSPDLPSVLHAFSILMGS